MKPFVALFALSTFLVGAQAEGDCTIDKSAWMYQGASSQNHKWPQNCPSCDASLEGNDRQSPIDLNPLLTNMGAKPLPRLTFTPNPDGATPGKFENKINTFQFTANDDQLSANNMCGGPLSGEYSFWQMHCHWGKSNYKPGVREPTKVVKTGSEHYINGKQYDAECHWVHFNNKYDTVGDAIASGDPDALSVVGVMLEIDSTNNQDDVEWIKTFNDAASGLVTPDTDAAELEWNVYGFLDQLGDQSQCFGYYNYLGGLTTPGCNQLVSFIIIDTPIRINLAQWANMYKLQADDASPQPQVQFNNFRVPQNVDADGNLIGAKRDVTKYVCPPGKVMCHCQSGGAFMELVSPDVVASQMEMPGAKSEL